MKPIEYLFRQMEIEGIQRTADTLISRTAPEVEDFPLVLAARTVDGDSLICYDDRLPAELRARLRSCDLQSFETEQAIRLLADWGIEAKPGSFRTYIFPAGMGATFVPAASCYDGSDPRVIAFGFQGFSDQVFAIEEQGRIVSACVSIRQNLGCGEAWVFTDPEHRRRGLARQAVTAWAGALLRQGITPLYSHSLSNSASAQLAQSLGLIPVYDEAVIERA
jgi:GNAT superfamily N-acetyltransferase